MVGNVRDRTHNLYVRAGPGQRGEHSDGHRQRRRNLVFFPSGGPIARLAGERQDAEADRFRREHRDENLQKRGYRRRTERRVGADDGEARDQRGRAVGRLEIDRERDNGQGESFADVTKGYCLTTDPDRSAHRDYMEAAGQNGIPTAFIVGKTGEIEWIGHPMEMDGPIEQIVAGSWDRDVYIAERAGLMPQVDAWVVDHSLELLARLRRDHDPDFRLEVNLSGHSIGKPEIELPERGRALTIPAARWNQATTMTVGFGHSIAVTPLHLAIGYATLYNGGIYRPATLQIGRAHV